MSDIIPSCREPTKHERIFLVNKKEYSFKKLQDADFMEDGD